MSYNTAAFYPNMPLHNHHDHHIHNMSHPAQWGASYDPALLDEDWHQQLQYDSTTSTTVHIKQEPEPDYGSLIRSLAPLAAQALRSSFAAPNPMGAGPSPPYSPNNIGMAPTAFGYRPHPGQVQAGMTQEQMLYMLSRYTDDDPNGAPPSSFSNSSSASSSRQTSPIGDGLTDPRLPCTYPGCTRTFKREYTRSVHMITHEPRERQRFRCSLSGCQEEFSRRHDRFRHEVHMHGLVSEWKCDDCGKFFAKEVTLVKHACPAKRMNTR